MKKQIAIIDYGVGNTQSVKDALGMLDCDVRITDSVEDLKAADALILPGVGAYEAAMNNLRSRELVSPLTDLVVKNKKPILGICLGMQLLADTSEENGLHQGLGWIPGRVTKIENKNALRVPHVGWNDVQMVGDSPLFNRIRGEANFYFDHSYHFQPTNSRDIVATVDYGTPLVAAVQHLNIFGVQFHPEKSQLTGLRLMKGFINSILYNA